MSHWLKYHPQLKKLPIKAKIYAGLKKKKMENALKQSVKADV